MERVAGESGEDCLFSAARFVAIDVPAAVKASLLKASGRLIVTVPVGVPVSPAKPCHSVSVEDMA